MVAIRTILVLLVVWLLFYLFTLWQALVLVGIGGLILAVLYATVRVGKERFCSKPVQLSDQAHEVPFPAHKICIWDYCCQGREILARRPTHENNSMLSG
jgi:hypothetical protein